MFWPVAFYLAGWRFRPFLFHPVKNRVKDFDMMPHDRYGLSILQAESIDFYVPCYADGMRAGKPSKSDKTDFAERLCRLREAAGLSQRAVAKQMDISQPSYANWETHNVSLKPEQITRLAKVLGVRVEELLEEPRSGSRRGGPKGRVRQVFEMVANLPRGQQQQIVEVVEAIVEKKIAASR